MSEVRRLDKTNQAPRFCAAVRQNWRVASRDVYKWGVVLIFAPYVCQGQTIQSVVDAAGAGPRAAPGGLASVLGTNLGTAAQSSGFPLTTTLGGSSVLIQGVQAPLFAVSPTQIDFQVPSTVNAGQVSLVVQTASGNSNSFTFTVTTAAPAILQTGGQALAYNADGSQNSSSSPAAAGSVITVSLSGIGPVDNSVPDGSATPASPTSTATSSSSATIGPQSASIQFLGLAVGGAGLGQANIQVPTISTGNYPLVITIGGYVSASAVVSVSGTGTAYTSPLSLVSTAPFANTSNSTIQLLGTTAYICSADRIVMVDVTNAAQPNVLGEFGDSVLNGQGNFCVINQTVSPPYLVEVVGNLDLPVSFAVYDLTTPTAPQLLGFTATQNAYIVDLSFFGPYAYASTSYLTYYNNNDSIAAQNGDFLAYNFSAPGTPQEISILQPNGEPGSGDMNLKPGAAVVNQLYAYVVGSSATGTSVSGQGVLDVISISSPTAMLAVYQLAVSQADILIGFAISGNTMLVAGNTGGDRDPGRPDFDFIGNLTLTTMDVTNSQVPVPLATVTTNLQVNGTYNVAAFSNGVFAIVNNPPDTDNSGPESLMIVDARTPGNPQLYPFQTQFGFNGLVATTGGYLLAPTLQGLNLYKLQLQ